jgi:hypothetical protein
MNLVKDVNLGRIRIVAHSPIFGSLDNHVWVTSQAYGFFSIDGDYGAGIGCNMVPCCIYLWAWVLYVDRGSFIISPQRVILRRLVEVDRYAFVEDWCCSLSAVDEM